MICPDKDTLVLVVVFCPTFSPLSPGRVVWVILCHLLLSYSVHCPVIVMLMRWSAAQKLNRSEKVVSVTVSSSQIEQLGAANCPLAAPFTTRLPCGKWMRIFVCHHEHQMRLLSITVTAFNGLSYENCKSRLSPHLMATSPDELPAELESGH